MRTIQGINPNCSELVVRLGSTDYVDNLINNVLCEIETAGLRIAQRDNDGKMRILDKSELTEIRLYITGEFNRYAPDADRYIGRAKYSLPHPDPNLPTVSITEEDHAQIYIAEVHDNEVVESVNISIGGLINDNDDDMYIMIGNYDKEYFHIIASLVEKWGFEYHGWDGGGTSAFTEWAEENGYSV